MKSKYEPLLSKWHGRHLKWPKSFKLVYKATQNGDFPD